MTCAPRTPTASRSAFRCSARKPSSTWSPSSATTCSSSAAIRRTGPRTPSADAGLLLPVPEDREKHLQHQDAGGEEQVAADHLEEGDARGDLRPAGDGEQDRGDDTDGHADHGLQEQVSEARDKPAVALVGE